MTGDDMAALRRRLTLTQEAFGDRIGLSKRQVASLEGGEVAVTLTAALACRAIEEGWLDYDQKT